MLPEEEGVLIITQREGAQVLYLLTCLLEPPCAEIWMSTLASGKSKELSPTYDGRRTDIGGDLTLAVT